MITKTTLPILGILAPWAMVPTGCHDPRAERAGRARLERTEQYRQMFIAREQDGPRRLSATSNLIEREARWHAGHLHRDLGRLRDWRRQDEQRWRDRQPRYRSDFEEYWAGDQDLAVEIIPRMFY